MLVTILVDTAFGNVNADLAMAWFHWFLMRRPEPFPETIHASCEEYRAITLDLNHHAVDRDKKVSYPLLALWGGSRDTHPGWSTNVVDPLTVWRERCEDARGRPLDCGNFLAEERPEETLQEILSFIAED